MCFLIIQSLEWNRYYLMEMRSIHEWTVFTWKGKRRLQCLYREGRSNCTHFDSFSPLFFKRKKYNKFSFCADFIIYSNSFTIHKFHFDLIRNHKEKWDFSLALNITRFCNEEYMNWIHAFKTSYRLNSNNWCFVCFSSLYFEKNFI